MIVKASFDHIKTLTMPAPQFSAYGSSKYKLTKNAELKTNQTPRDTEKKDNKTTKTLFGRVNKEVVRNKINAYYHYYKNSKKFYFYTISYPQDIADDIAKISFNTWLTRLRKINPDMSYIWVAERQKNNTIHFHLIMNERFDIQSVNGFMASSIQNLIKKFNLTDINFDSTKYNGVDVKKIYNHRTLGAYITKYITKAKVTIKGRAWGTSRDVSKMFTEVVITVDEFESIKHKYTHYKTFKKDIPALNTIVTINYYSAGDMQETDFVDILNKLNIYALSLDSV